MASLYTYLLLMSKHFKLTNWRDFSFLVLTQDFYLTYIILQSVQARMSVAVSYSAIFECFSKTLHTNSFDLQHQQSTSDSDIPY
jgi:hypothetical protein